MFNYLIRDLNKDEKPREKAINIGIENLTDCELVALILGSGGKNISVLELTHTLLNKYNGIKGLLTTDITQLVTNKYINLAKACSLKACMEISKRLADNPKKFIVVKTPKDVFQILKKETSNKEKELLFVITLNSRNRLISKECISIGSLSETILSTREIFKLVFLRNAASFILAHNHPSGDSSPSKEDIETTALIAKAAKAIDIPLLDHVIVTNTDFFSMKANNLFTMYKIEDNNTFSKGGEDNEIIEQN